MLNLSHELLAYTVPFVLGKINRVSFGILAEEQQLPSDTISRRLLAVPFVGKDSPSRASEFSHPDVVISLTILAFRYQGLRMRDFLTIMHRLKRDMARQFGPYHKREACRRFVAWVDGAGARVRG